ncbi:hypothetical protein KAX22_03205 [bacterium]|nr:hypothetical protein [bacterium]
MHKRFSDLSRICRLFVFAVWISAAAFLIFALLKMQVPEHAVLSSGELLFWASLVILSESLVIYLPFSGCLSIGTAIDIPIILMFGPTLAAVYGILGALSSSLVTRRTPLYRVLFNIGLFILTMGISSWVYQELATGVDFVQNPRLIAVFILTIMVYFVLNSGLLSIVIGLSEGISPKAIWVENHSWTISYLLILAAIGYLMLMVNFTLGKWAVILLLLPVLLIRKAYSQCMDLKKMQDQLVQSERLAAVGQMVAGISHEIDNPIGIIMGHSDYLLQKMSHSDSRIQDIKTIRKEAARCKATVQEFLNFAQPKTKVKVVNVNTAVNNVISLLRHDIASRNIEVFFEENTTLPSIKGDIKQLEQVFFNVMLNAFQAMPNGGRLHISAGIAENPHQKERFFTVRIWRKQSKDNVIQVKFKDTGCGIPRENLKQLFMPFFTTRSEEGGRGLGLFVSHQIIQEHGGIFQIESELGRGTLVIVSLPFIRDN